MDLLIGDVFRSAARAVPQRVAVVHHGAALTFAELDEQAQVLAGALRARGVATGDRVAVWSDTRLDIAPLFAALAQLGAAFAPVNSTLSAAEATPIVASALPALLVVDPEHSEEGVAVAAASGCPIASVPDLAQGSPSSAPCSSPAASETDPHVVFFTSGSTGRPKGVVLSHRVSFLRTFTGALVEPRGTLVCPYPLFHMGAWTLALQQWQARDRIVFVAPDPVEICDAIAEHRATRLNCIPAVWRRVLDLLDSVAGAGAAPDVSTVRFADSGTSATPVELLEAIAGAFPNAQVRVFYGSTEAGSVSCLEHADFRRKPGSCGVPSPGAEVRVDEHGELWTRGPMLFDGYFDDPDATAAVMDDGWFRTGDLAELDTDGYLSIVGRARDVIRTGGESVAPREVEDALVGHPAVADLAVVGLPDVQWGEVVCAVIVLKAGCEQPPSLDDLRAWCGGSLAPYKHPRRVEVVDTIPRTASNGKTRRSLLVAQLSSRRRPLEIGSS
jgi:fatty-acyl-CoA synthase